MLTESHTIPLKHTNSRIRRYLPYIIAFLLIQLLGAILLLTAYNRNLTLFLNEKIRRESITYSSTINTYQLVSNTIYNEIINQPDVLHIFEQAYEADEPKRATLRQELFTLLNPTYQNLVKGNLRQLHFHLPDGSSFLRFHRPEKFGDPLFDVRYSVMVANINKVPVSGFEEGRIYNGFRYVFPLFTPANNDSESNLATHIGSVETSISFEAIRSEMALLSNSEYLFMISKAVVSEKVFDEEQSNYVPSNLSDDYLYERSWVDSRSTEENQNIPPDIIDQLNEKIRPSLKTYTDNTTPFAIPVNLDGSGYIATFIPILNTQEEPTGLLVAYDHNNFIRDLNRDYISLAIGWTFANILLVSFLYYANKQTILRAAQVETLAQTNKQLANEIEQRIETEIHLHEARLLAEKAQETAETANLAKSTFLASMSHELRTPLNGIFGYTQLLLLDSSLNSKQKHGLEIIQNSGEHLLQLLNDILDLSKIESGKMSLNINRIDLSSFLRNISEMMEMNAENKGLTYVCQNKTAVSHAIYADNIRLRQVLINLLGNAIKFTNAGGHVTLTILNITPDDYPAKRCLFRFEIEDSGIGISETNIEKIFAPFEQLGTHLYSQEGTGLGLSISSKLLAMMGTTLQVKSEVGKGSYFWFDLDVEAAESETAVIPTASPHPSIHGISGKKPVILVVDDHAGNRRLLVELLTPFGFTVITNNNGQAALETVTKKRPHLILMDLVMPEMDGYETVRRIRKLFADNQEEHCPIIAISANAFTEDRKQSLEAGCDDFISKPFKARLLLAMMEKHLGSSWGWLREDSNDASTTKNRSTTLPPLSTSITTTLLDFVTVGDVRGLKQQLVILLDQEEIAPETAAMFNKLIRNYQISELNTLLQSYLV